MGDETPDSMNLDLNLSPGPEPMTNVPIELDTLDDGHLRRMREAVRIGARQRSRWRRFHLTPETVSVGLNHLMVNSEAGEGSEEKSKKKNGSENGFGKSEDTEKEERKNEADIGGEGSFFDCNICLDLAKSPVVTCCGHLFCWPCLYRWLHFHSDAKECPVCKGEVTFKNVTPIYGRGGTHNRRDPDGKEEQEEEGDGSSLKVPDRPQARRVESLRQTIQRNMLSLPMDEMIRRIGTRFDLRGDLFAQNNNHDGDGDNTFLETARESAERTNTLLTRILSARGFRREQYPTVPATADEQNPTAGEEGRRFQFRQTSNPNPNQNNGRTGFPTLSSSFLVEAFRAQPSQSQQVGPGAGDDRDSFSSIAAVINSESLVDTAAEIDSLVSLSTSSRRRNEAGSRASDLDTGDSRAPRRRRFN